MKKIVILGCENSHANSFLDFIRDDEKYRDVEVVGVYSDDIEAANKLCEKYGTPVMNSYEEAVGRVDGVIVTARHGANHYKYASPYIKSGVPMFIDKPVTVSGEEALEFMRLCRESGVKITGGSCCKHADAVKAAKKAREENLDGDTLSGVVRAPVNMNNNYGGFYFYSQHLVEMVCEIYGRYPKSLRAFQKGNSITVVFRYENYDVTGLFTEGSNKYHLVRMAQDSTVLFEADIGKACFHAEFDEFYDILSGEEQKISYDDFIAPVYILNAIDESLKNGEDAFVKEFKV